MASLGSNVERAQFEVKYNSQRVTGCAHKLLTLANLVEDEHKWINKQCHYIHVPKGQTLLNLVETRKV